VTAMRVLTSILNQAVFEVRVDSTKLFKVTLAPRTYCYWISVVPDHYKYWECFRETHPQWRQIALKYGASRTTLDFHGYCPEFPSMRSLVSWLFDVLKLSQGERRLLTLSIQGGRWSVF